MKKYPPIQEIEPGITKYTNSKFIRKVVIRFVGSTKFEGVIQTGI